MSADTELLDSSSRRDEMSYDFLSNWKKKQSSLCTALQELNKFRQGVGVNSVPASPSFSAAIWQLRLIPFLPVERLTQLVIDRGTTEEVELMRTANKYVIHEQVLRIVFPALQLVLALSKYGRRPALSR